MDEKSIFEEQLNVVRGKLIEKEMSNDDALMFIEDYILSSCEMYSLNECEAIIKKLYAKTRCKLGILEDLVNNSAISEIMVNGKDNIFIESKGKLYRHVGALDSTEELEDIIRNIAADVHREINEMNPIVDARLADGSRVNAVYKNIAINGPILTIRKFGKERITVNQLIEKETITKQCADFLEKLVKCGFNIFISGGTSSGKTTFLNALSEFIPPGERVIVIEDSSELQLNDIENLVQMECHNANSLGKGKITMDMLIKTSLRMRPDRIIVGEVRGREVSDMLQAMNTGHPGSMSTGHGNSISGMLRRLEAMYLMSAQLPMDAIRAQIIEGIDIMIHLARLDDGSRKVVAIEELLDYDQGKYITNPLYFLNENRELVCSGNQLVNRFKFITKD